MVQFISTVLKKLAIGLSGPMHVRSYSARYNKPKPIKKFPSPPKPHSYSARYNKPKPIKKFPSPPKPHKYVSWPLTPMGTLKGSSDGSRNGDISGCAFLFRIHVGLLNGKICLGKFVDGKYLLLPSGSDPVICEGTGILESMKRADVLNAHLFLRLLFESDSLSFVGAVNRDNEIDSKYEKLVFKVQEMKKYLAKKYGVCELVWVNGEVNGVADILSKVQLEADILSKMQMQLELKPDILPSLDFPTLDSMDKIDKTLKAKVVDRLVSDARGVKYRDV